MTNSGLSASSTRDVEELAITLRVQGSPGPAFARYRRCRTSDGALASDAFGSSIRRAQTVVAASTRFRSCEYLVFPPGWGRAPAHREIDAAL
jgi:hypothetical protein